MRYTSRMKIAMIVRKMNIRGGVQRHVLSLAKELTARGHDVTLYTFSFSPEHCYPEMLDACKVISLDKTPDSWTRLLPEFLHEYRQARHLALLIDPHTDVLNPDHATHRVAYYFKKYVRNIPSVWMMHDIPLRSIARMRMPHTKRSVLRRFLGALLDYYETSRFINAQDYLTVHGNRDREWVREYFHKNAEVVHSGIDPAYFTYRAKQPPRKNSVTLLMSGIFLPHRRFEDGIEAASLLKAQGYKVHLRIIGDYNFDTSYYCVLKEVAECRGIIQEVTFCGNISEEELLNHYYTSDILVFPNHLQSWGLAVFEAMACGMPVIVSHTAGASEILTHGENALIINPKSPQEIASAVRHLIAQPDIYTHLSKNGRAFVETHLSWKELADTMEHIFKKAILSRGSTS